MAFNVGDTVNLRLHRRYRLPAIQNRKLGQQLVDPLRIKRQVGKLAYELEIPKNWKIHPVISVAHLESVTIREYDPFHRDRPDHSRLVFVEGNTETSKSYEVEVIVGKRTSKDKYGEIKVEYLM